MSTANVYSIAQSGSDVELLAPGPRRGFTVYNDATVHMYVKMGGPASPTDYSVKIAPGGFFWDELSYDGTVHAIWDSAGSGAAKVTEVRH